MQPYISQRASFPIGMEMVFPISMDEPLVLQFPAFPGHPKANPEDLLPGKGLAPGIGLGTADRSLDLAGDDHAMPLLVNVREGPRREGEGDLL